MFRFQLTYKSNSFFRVEKLHKVFLLFPCGFSYSNKTPKYELKDYRKNICVGFFWLLWNFELVIRKKRKHENK